MSASVMHNISAIYCTIYRSYSWMNMTILSLCTLDCISSTEKLLFSCASTVLNAILKQQKLLCNALIVCVDFYHFHDPAVLLRRRNGRKTHVKTIPFECNGRNAINAWKTAFDGTQVPASFRSTTGIPHFFFFFFYLLRLAKAIVLFSLLSNSMRFVYKKKKKRNRVTSKKKKKEIYQNSYLRIFRYFYLFPFVSHKTKYYSARYTYVLFNMTKSMLLRWDAMVAAQKMIVQKKTRKNTKKSHT